MIAYKIHGMNETAEATMGQTHRMMNDLISKKTTSTLFSIVTVASLLLLCSTSPAFAVNEFDGALKSVSITDAARSNTPPDANFTYIIDGDVITLDASNSSDPDGTITKYQWDFGNGNTAEGITASYSIINNTPPQVTLTIIDNDSAAMITQQTITIAQVGVNDDFSNDTASDYTIASGDLSIYNGTLHGKTWATTIAFHNNELASNNHSAQANVYYSGGNSGAGLLIGGDLSAQTGYLFFMESGRPVLKYYNVGKEVWVATGNGSFASGIYHLRATSQEPTLRLFINDQLVLEKSVATSIGKHIGLRIRTENDLDIVTLDNLTGSIE